MRLSHVVLYVMPLIPAAAVWAQAPNNAIQKQNTPAGAAAPVTVAPTAAPTAAAASPLPGASTILRPALDEVQQTLNALKLDKWKHGSVRDEAGTDIGSVRSDIQVNLPPLLKDSDNAPGTLSKSIPVARNVDALYDVLLRVVEASRIAAPDDQANALRQTLVTLSSARLALYDRMQDSAASQEKQMSDLRVTVQKQAAFKCPPPPPAPICPAPAPAKKRRPKPPAGTTTPQTTPQKLATPPSGTTPKPGL